VINATLLPSYPQEREPVPIAPEAQWAPGPIWKGEKNLAFTEVRTPDLPIFTYILLLPEGQCVKALEHPNDAMFFRSSEEHRIEKYCHADF
jgi:hypothetical protein